MNNNNPIGPKDQPTPTARATIITTSGQIQIQIFAKQTPLASRNFIQLALEGYYNDTIFHRMIPGFMIQGGDPTGTGTGGQSIYGKPFKDQFHQRLRFGRRGLVAMANSGKDTNGSQFFITFGQCPHLNKKHTIFGRVVGNSMFNLLEMQSLDTDSNDKPLYPPSIRKIKIILNPFDDIIPRTSAKAPQSTHKPLINSQQNNNNANIDNNNNKTKKSQIKKLKNKNKLTFEQQLQPAEHDQTSYKIKSSHDTLNDEKLSKQVAVKQEDLEKKRKQKQIQKAKKQQISRKVNQAAMLEEKQKEEQGIQEILKAQLLKKKRNAGTGEGQKTIQDQVLNYRKKVNQQTGKVEIVWGDAEEQQAQNQNQQKQEEIKMQKLRQLQQRQYQALKADQLNFKKMKQGSAKQRRKKLVAQQKTLLSNAQKKRYQYLKKNAVEKREGEVLAKLNKFTQRLKADNPNDWMCHSLKFHIDSQNAYSLDKKNQERKMRGQGKQDEDDGGLKVEFGTGGAGDQDMNIDQLYNLAMKNDDQQ